MATYSDNLLLSLLALGESGVHGFANWGEAAASNFEFLEDTVSEKADITLVGTNVTLTAAQERALYLNLTGTLSANVEVRTNDRKGFWFVSNGTSGSYTVTVKPTSGSGVVVVQGQKAILYCDGTNIVSLGLSIGVDVQAYDAGLQSIAGLTTAADRMLYTTASDTYAVATLTAAGRAILDDANAAAQLTTLGALPVAGGTMTGNLRISYSNPVSVPAAGESTHGFRLGAVGYGLTAGALSNGTAYIQSTRWDGAAINYNLSIQPNGGNVGIGTLSPSKRLHISNGGTRNVILDVDTFSGSLAAIGFGTTVTATNYAVLGDGANTFFNGASTLSWRISNITKMFMDAAGNVGVGTTSPAQTLDVNGAIAAATVAGPWIASQAEAEAGTATTKVMTPERTAQAIAAQVSSSGWAVAGSWTYSSAVANIDFTNLGAYSEIAILIPTALAHASDVPGVRLSTDNGTSYAVTGYESNAIQGATSAFSTSLLRLSHATVTGLGRSVVHLVGFNVAGAKTAMHGTSDNLTQVNGFRQTAEVNNALRITCASGATFTAGAITILGRK